MTEGEQCSYKLDFPNYADGDFIELDVSMITNVNIFVYQGAESLFFGDSIEVGVTYVTIQFSAE